LHRAQNGYDVATGAAHYGFLNFTRDQEYAADVFGADIAAKAGFDPWGTVWFFQTLVHVNGDSGYEQYLQHHPSTSDRIAHIEKHFASDPATFGHYSKVATTMSGLPVTGKL
jgi:predicted Zn-dependent protease